MSDTNLKILVVEDDASTGELIVTRLNKLRAHFPGAVFVLVKSRAEAFVVLQESPSPDVTLLDLSLPDSSIIETIDAIPRIENICPVVIVSGHSQEMIRELLMKRNLADIDVVQKGGAVGLAWMDPLIDMIFKALSRWQKMRFARISKHLNTWQALLKDAPPQQ